MAEIDPDKLAHKTFIFTLLYTVILVVAVILFIL